MAKAQDKAREQRIEMEIVVDCHDSEERVMAWYNYLLDSIQPFTARCTVKRAISPLEVGDEVEVNGMAPEKECLHEMFVMARCNREGQAVPLSQLKPGSDADRETRQAVEDWLYWVKQGYEF